MKKSKVFIKKMSLYSGSIKVLTVNGTRFSAPGKIWLEYHPRLALKWQLFWRKKSKPPSQFLPNGGLKFANFEIINGITNSPFINNRVWSTDKPLELAGGVTNFSFGDSEFLINRIHLECVNFEFSSSFTSLNIRVLGVGDFLISLKKVDDYDVLIGELKDEGSFAVTSTVEISKKDSGDFNYEEVRPLLRSLFWAFSFSNGGFCNSVKTQGFYGKDLIWTKYSSLASTAIYEMKDNWCHSTYPGQFLDFVKQFPQFYSVSSTICWEWSWNACIHWYLHALDSDTVESKILHTQAALELFSWTYLVQDTKVYSKRKYKSQSFSNNLRELLNKLKIDYSRRVASFAVTNPTDAIDDFVALRNDIVHPEKTSKFASLTDKAKVAADGLRILELVILAKIDFNGIYLDRRESPFEGKKVPW